MERKFMTTIKIGDIDRKEVSAHAVRHVESQGESYRDAIIEQPTLQEHLYSVSCLEISAQQEEEMTQGLIDEIVGLRELCEKNDASYIRFLTV